MATWSPLTTHWAVNLQDCSPRYGTKIDTIIHHHVAGTNKLATLAIFAPGGREATPNYFIAGREIWGIVPEDYRAWTSGSYLDDQRAITYEILNSTGGPQWGFDPVTLDTVARLDADIARRYGVPLRRAQPGFMEHRNVYEWFGRGFPTACAGPSFNINQMIAATAAKLNPSTPAEPEKVDEEMWKPEVVARTASGKDTEWMLVHPEIGLDLKAGEKSVEGNITRFRGYMVTTVATVGQAWGRLYARQFGNAPTRHERTNYIAIQSEAQRLSLELAKG